jgi:hypothetical protein
MYRKSIKMFINETLFLFVIFAIQLNLKNVCGDPKRVKFKRIVVDYGNQVYSRVHYQEQEPNQRILVSILIKNHAHALPKFLATLETLECPTYNKKCDLRYLN